MNRLISYFSFVLLMNSVHCSGLLSMQAPVPEERTTSSGCKCDAACTCRVKGVCCGKIVPQKDEGSSSDKRILAGKCTCNTSTKVVEKQDEGKRCH